MFCSNCGSKLCKYNSRCNVCKINSGQDNKIFSNQYKNFQKTNVFKQNKCWFWIIILVIIVSLLFIYILVNRPNKRRDALLNIERTDYTKFILDNKEFYIGDKVWEYKKKDISFEDKYLTEQSYVESDSIAMHNFYNKSKESQFLGMFYCAKFEKCKYEDTLLIKINFYPNSNVIVNDFIKYGIKYDEVVKAYGEEDGTFYQDEDFLVWTFGDKGKIGNPYYLLRFDNNSFFSQGKLSEIRIGIWWYEDEYKHSVVAKKEGGKV